MKRNLTKDFIDEIYSNTPMRSYPTENLTYNHINEICSFDLADMTDYKDLNKKVKNLYSE